MIISTTLDSLKSYSEFNHNRTKFHSFQKRLLDIVFSILILILIMPVLLIIALSIKLTSPGPILFKQLRNGKDGQKIEVWKFRSMTVCENGSAIKQARKNDPRVTKLGGFLRRTSLDELPQFFNVLQGRMSIVGPRPHAIAHNHYYQSRIPNYNLRHQIKPGITGWAQINGWRGETETLDKMAMRIKFDLDYIHNRNLFLDIKIIIMTVFLGLVNKNAY